MEAVSGVDSASESDLDAAEGDAGTDDAGSESDVEGFAAEKGPDSVAPLL